MKAKRYISILMLAFLIIAGNTFAQDVLTLEPYNISQQGLVEQIIADTTANSGIPEGRIYELLGGEVYLVKNQFYLEAEYTLHLRSSNDQRAIVYMFPTGTGDNPQQPPGYFVRSRGGDMIIEGLAISAFYEPGDDPAANNFDYFYNVQGGLFRTDNEGASFIATNCIFSNIAGQILRTNASTQMIYVADCIFANLGALSTSNFGAGKGIDLRESSCDSLILVNNTFVNYQDRPIRHYNYGDPLAGTGNIEYGRIDHNTFVNGMGFHGLLSLGNVGAEMHITNNLFVDAFAAGEDSTDETRTAEWANTGEQYDNGNNRMAWIFAAPTGNTDWTVSNNYYSVTSQGQSFFDTYAEIDVGNPLSIYIRDELGAAADAAFQMVPDPQLTNVPDLMLGMMTYYIEVAGKTKDTPNDYWDPQTEDMDRRPITYYINDFDVAYSTGSAAYTGAMDGFPAGDLNAFPDKKAEWENPIVEHVLLLEPYNINQKGLVEQIMEDTTANGGIIDDRVYELIGGEIYLVKNQFYLAADYTLNLRSSNDQRAIVYMFPTGTGDNPQQPPGYFVRSRGGDMIIQDIALSGYYEPGDNPAGNNFDYFYNVQGGMFRTDNEGASFIATNCIFSNIAGQILRTNASTQMIYVADCIFANLGALSTSNFGAGKGIDLRESSCDSLILVNNTFVNYQDRPIRHYNFGDPLAGTGNIEYGRIDHNTFVNGMGFHGLLSLGNVGAEMHITNNLFVDAFAAGEDSTDVTRTAEWANTGEQYDNGNNRMAWIFAAPTGNTDWTVSNNYYSVTSQGQSFFDTYAEIDVGNPLSIYIRNELGGAADAAFQMVPDPQLTNVPDLMLGMMTYYVEVANKTKDTPNDYWDPQTEDMDRRPITYYINDFDVAYSTGSAAYTGAMGGFPAGDLNAFPDKKAEWRLTSVERDTEEALTNEFTLSQNYPNPFNPATTINFSIPKQSNVTLKVYNMLGQEVALLVDEVMNAGSYKVHFNAGNLSSGVYFYSIQSDNFMATKKMILLK